MQNTLRDKIAIGAMKSLIIDKELHKLYGKEEKFFKIVAIRAYKIADELLKARIQ